MNCKCCDQNIPHEIIDPLTGDVEPLCEVCLEISESASLDEHYEQDIYLLDFVGDSIYDL